MNNADPSVTAQSNNPGGAGGSAGSGGAGGSAGTASAVSGSGGSEVGAAPVVVGPGAVAASGTGGSMALGVAGSSSMGGSGGAPVVDAGGGDARPNDSVSYAADVQPILVAQCSPCHSTLGLGGHNAASSFADAVRVANTIIREITSGGMPAAGNGNQGCNRGRPGSPGCVSVEDLATIQSWVDAGTPP